MGFISVFKSLKELFPQIDTKILRDLAIKYPNNADEAAEAVFLSEIVPHLSIGDYFNQPENKSSEETLKVCKVEPEEGNLSLNQWLNPTKVPQSYLALLNEDESSTPDEKKPANIDHVMKKVVQPSGDDGGDVGGGIIRNLFSASDKAGPSSSSSVVKPSIPVKSQTKTENVSGSGSKVKRSSNESARTEYHDYTERLRSWDKRNNTNRKRYDFSYLFDKHKDLPSKQSNKSKKKNSNVTDRDRKKRIDDNIKALAELLPNEYKKEDSLESILNDAISHVKLLQLQMKDLSRSRLGEEVITHPMTYIEGYGHFLHKEKTMTKSLEEEMEELLANDPEAAKSLLESKGLYLMPLSSVQGFC